MANRLTPKTVASDRRRTPDGVLLRASPQTRIAPAKPALERVTPSGGGMYSPVDGAWAYDPGGDA